MAMTSPPTISDMDIQLYHEADNITPDIIEMYYKNRRVSDKTFYALIAAYSVLICVGVCGNILVVLVVLKKPAMRTARNIFILNLAISDLLLCMVTMPLTLMEILTRYWPLGDNAFICKIIGVSQATSIFVSTFSITAIALDRYQLIVNPTRDSLHRLGALIALASIWVTSLILAGPMYLFKKLDFPANVSFITDQLQLEILAYCFEDWPIAHGRGIYSGVCLILQYVLPIITVTIAYSQICRKLQYRQVAARASTSRRRPRDDRRRKTNTLLVAITLVYCLSWLPLNVFNIVQDFNDLFEGDHQTMMLVYALCHMAGMSSACSNPLLYGWLNDNFRKEFKEIIAITCHCTNNENPGPGWLESFRSSLSKQRSRQRSDSSCERISMKPKAATEVEEGSVYVDDLKGKEMEKSRRTVGMEKTNVTMTTSLENDDDGNEHADVTPNNVAT